MNFSTKTTLQTSHTIVDTAKANDPDTRVFEMKFNIPLTYTSEEDLLRQIKKLVPRFDFEDKLYLFPVSVQKISHQTYLVVWYGADTGKSRQQWNPNPPYRL